MKVGFWLDWNTNIQNEMRLHSQTLELVVFDSPVTSILIEKPADVARFDGDLLTFDYGGICGGYGPNRIVPVLLRAVHKWCRDNADRLALLWCTFPPDWYLQDFKRHGGVPGNLRTWYQGGDALLHQELRRHYNLERQEETRD